MSFKLLHVEYYINTSFTNEFLIAEYNGCSKWDHC